MKRKQWARILAAILFTAYLGCGQEGEAPMEVTPYSAPVTRQTPTLSSEPIPPENIGDNRFFYGAEKTSDITDGGFELFSGGKRYPDGWDVLQSAPRCKLEQTIVRFGQASAKLTGRKASKTMLKTVTAPTPEELRGKSVVFGVWIYTPNPEKVHIQIIEDWKQWTDVKPTKTNEWELLKITRVLREELKEVYFVLALDASDPQAVCYADGAALIVRPVTE